MTALEKLIEHHVSTPALARRIGEAGRVYTGISAADIKATGADAKATNADTKATNAGNRLDSPNLLLNYSINLDIQSINGALKLANLPTIPDTKLGAIADPAKVVNATLGVLQNASAGQSGYAGFQSVVGANLLGAWTVVAGRAIIANATIQDAHVHDLSASTLTAGTINTGVINLASSLVVQSGGRIALSGALALDDTGLNLVGRSGDVELPNQGTAAKITPFHFTAGDQYGAFSFYSNPANSVRGILEVATGQGSALEGLIRLSALTTGASGFADAATANLLVQSVQNGRGQVELRGTNLLITAGGSLNLSNAPRLIAPYELPSTVFSPSAAGGSAFQRAHGLGGIPRIVLLQYSGVSQVGWRNGNGISQGADVSYNWDATYIYFYNNRSENTYIRIAAFL